MFQRGKHKKSDPLPIIEINPLDVETCWSLSVFILSFWYHVFHKLQSAGPSLDDLLHRFALFPPFPFPLMFSQPTLPNAILSVDNL